MGAHVIERKVTDAHDALLEQVARIKQAVTGKCIVIDLRQGVARAGSTLASAIVVAHSGQHYAGELRVVRQCALSQSGHTVREDDVA